MRERLCGWRLHLQARGRASGRGQAAHRISHPEVPTSEPQPHSDLSMSCKRGSRELGWEW